MRPTAPPLWTWAVAAALALIVLAAMRFDPAGRIDLDYDQNLARLDRAQSRDRPLVVIIGASKIECAVAFDTELTDEVNAAGGSADVIRITQREGDFATLQHALARTAQAKPDMVLLEEDLLLYAKKVPRAARPEPWRDRAVRSVRKRLGRPGRLFNYPGPHTGPCPDPPADMQVFVADYMRDKAELRTSTSAERAAYLGYIDRWRAGGSKVYLLAVPRSPQAEQYVPAALNTGAAAALSELQGAHHLERLVRPEAMPQSAFGDFGHAGSQGRRLYMDWLAPEIARLLGDV